MHCQHQTVGKADLFALVDHTYSSTLDNFLLA